MVSPAPPGAATLRRLRNSARLSQEQLALRSGVSERTVRGLESGAIKTPQAATLRALAVPLRLRGAEIELLVNAWRLEQVPVELAELTERSELDFELYAELADQPNRIREITKVYRTRIDAHGRLASVELDRIFEVLSESVDRFFWVQGYDPEGLDPSRVRLSTTVNCAAGRQIVVEEGMQVHELLLATSVPRGSRHLLSYTADFSAAHRVRAGRQPVPETESLAGWPSASTATSVVQVQFDPARLPARVWAVAQRTLARDVPPARTLELNAFHIAQDIVEHPPAGTHGIRWAWD